MPSVSSYLQVWRGGVSERVRQPGGPHGGQRVRQVQVREEEKKETATGAMVGVDGAMEAWKGTRRSRAAAQARAATFPAHPLPAPARPPARPRRAQGRGRGGARAAGHAGAVLRGQTHCLRVLARHGCACCALRAVWLYCCAVLARAVCGGVAGAGWPGLVDRQGRRRRRLGQSARGCCARCCCLAAAPAAACWSSSQAWPPSSPAPQRPPARPQISGRRRAASTRRTAVRAAATATSCTCAPCRVSCASR